MKATESRNTISPMVYKLTMMALVVFIVVVYVFFKGNPLDAMKLNKQTDRYLKEKYPEIREQVYRSTDAYFIKNAGHDNNLLKDGAWYVYYSNDEDSFMHFNFVYSPDCEMIYDGCGDLYMNGGTIYRHFSDQYRNYIVEIHQDVYNNGMPKSGITISSVTGGDYAEAWFENGQHLTHSEKYEGPVLDINKKYTMEELANEYGVIHFRYNDDEKTPGQLYKRRLEVVTIVKEYNIPFNKAQIELGFFEGVFGLTKEELFSEDLKTIIEDNYTTLEDLTGNSESNNEQD